MRRKHFFHVSTQLFQKFNGVEEVYHVNNVFDRYFINDRYFFSFKSIFHLVVVSDDDSNIITYLLCDMSRS